LRGSEDNRKISWNAWSFISLPKEYEGLGVRRLKEFNIALLGKWCWRMLVDRGGCGSGCWRRDTVRRQGG